MRWRTPGVVPMFAPVRAVLGRLVGGIAKLLPEKIYRSAREKFKKIKGIAVWINLLIGNKYPHVEANGKISATLSEFGLATDDIAVIRMKAVLTDLLRQ